MKNPPIRKLPERPDLDQLKRQAKELLDAYRAEQPAARAEVALHYRVAGGEVFALHQAQLVLARSYGFASWPKLKAYTDGNTAGRLTEAVRANDLEQVKALLRTRPELASFVAPGNQGLTPLHYAVIARAPAMVEELMTHGADPGARTAGIYAMRHATTPLALARSRGFEEIVALLNAAHRQSPAPIESAIAEELHEALTDRNEDRVIDILSGHPGLIHTPLAGGGWSLLHIAAAQLLERTVKWLLTHGADINRKGPDGRTPLELCAQRDNGTDLQRRAMAELLRGHGVAQTLRSAILAGDSDYLKARAADLQPPQDERGWLLRMAVDAQRPDMLKLLLELGLDPDARARVEDDDENPFTWGMPLYECVRARDHEMAELLLVHGADANGQVYASGTPLSEAFGQRDEAMIALLERFGGQANPSMAGLYRRPDLARKLLAQHGAEELPDDGFSRGTVAEQLLGAAARGGDAEILRMAMERVSVPVGDPRWNGLLQGPLGYFNHWTGPWCHPEWDRTTYLACFRMLLERSGPPNAPLNCGATVLHQIVMMGDHVTAEERVAFAQAALDAGARLDLRDELLRATPLGWACRFGRPELVRLLIERGADAREAESEEWASPLRLAEQGGHAEIAELIRRT